MCTGVATLCSVCAPSIPVVSAPQQYTSPSKVSAQLLLRPATTCCALGSPATLSGSSLSSKPCPSAPLPPPTPALHAAVADQSAAVVAASAQLLDSPVELGHFLGELDLLQAPCLPLVRLAPAPHAAVHAEHAGVEAAARDAVHRDVEVA